MASTDQPLETFYAAGFDKAAESPAAILPNGGPPEGPPQDAPVKDDGPPPADVTTVGTEGTAPPPSSAAPGPPVPVEGTPQPPLPSDGAPVAALAPGASASAAEPPKEELSYELMSAQPPAPPQQQQKGQHQQSDPAMGQYLGNSQPYLIPAYSQNFRQQGFPYGQNFGFHGGVNAYGQPIVQFPPGSSEINFQQLQGQLEGMVQNNESNININELQNQQAQAAAAAGFPMQLQQLSMMGMSPDEQLYASMAGLNLGQHLQGGDQQGRGPGGQQQGGPGQQAQGPPPPPGHPGPPGGHHGHPGPGGQHQEGQSSGKGSWVDVVGRPEGYNQQPLFDPLALMGAPPPPPKTNKYKCNFISNKAVAEAEEEVVVVAEGAAEGGGRGRGGRDPSFSSNPLPEPVINYQKFEGINTQEIDLQPEGARYFVIKSYSEDDIHKSIKYGLWASTEQGNRRLDQAFQSAKGPVYLFYSVNASGQFCGMAQMKSAVDYSKKFGAWAQDKWKGQFEVQWIYAKDVPNRQLRHITLPNNENKPVTNSRDTQEVPEPQGVQVLRVFSEFQPNTSILDDFGYYDKRQLEMEDRQHQFPPPPPPPVQALYTGLHPHPHPPPPGPPFPGPPPFLPPAPAGSHVGGGRGSGGGRGRGRGAGGRGRFQGRGPPPSSSDELGDSYAPPSGPIQIQLLPAKRLPKQSRKKKGKGPHKIDEQDPKPDDHDSDPTVVANEDSLSPAVEGNEENVEGEEVAAASEAVDDTEESTKHPEDESPVEKKEGTVNQQSEEA
eukprot:CAMPEP_0117835334 /NCGR_PEP_ID=MMETSP0949-20121206/11433_1 /TAXON_ID=44440 /ORGANISM="Chattonella subsalsa, Strain CCMP2191" /LENGTH=774 /DNA_ID=CAMNT_0005677323 /DNA_START=229 /DNA_END=2555 /DNA_ORIENTATION=-